jgi:hypothetical protein
MVNVRPDVVAGIANTIGPAVEGGDADGGLAGVIGLLNSADDFQSSHLGADFSGQYGDVFVTGFDNVVAMLRQWSDAAQACGAMLRDNMRIVAAVDEQTKDSLENSLAGW